MDYGKLVYIDKTRKYCGKSQITNKAIYRVKYLLYFFKNGDKQVGTIAGIPFTIDKSFDRKSSMNKFLKDNNYQINI